MLCCRKLSFLPLFALVLLPSPSRAALIPTYDLTSLCCMSTDVVVVTFVWQRPPGQAKEIYAWEAVVVDPIEGQYHAGDMIGPVDFGLYRPAPLGPHTILFISRRQVTSPSYSMGVIKPDVIDILYTDPNNHVRRYFQWSDPGGLVAEGYSPLGVPEQSGLLEQRYPALTEERKIIVTKWVAAKKLKAPPYQVLHQTER